MGRERARLRRGGVWRSGGQRAAAEDTREGRDFPRSGARGPRVGPRGSCLEAGRRIRSGRYSIRRRLSSNLW